MTCVIPIVKTHHSVDQRCFEAPESNIHQPRHDDEAVPRVVSLHIPRCRRERANNEWLFWRRDPEHPNAASHSHKISGDNDDNSQFADR